MTDNKVIIVGAGHNGLTCAAYLAKAGADVVVLEAAERAGGLAATHEFAAGFKVSAGAPFLYQLQPQIVSDLELERHGLAFAAKDLACIALASDGGHVKIRGAQVDGPVGERDTHGLAEFRRLTERFAALLARHYNKKPPLLVNGRADDKVTLARLGLDLRRLGRDDMRDFLRVIAINIYDVLNEHLDNDLLKGALALDAVLGTHLGPRSPNSVLTYLHRLTGAVGGRAASLAQPLAGMGSAGEAFANAAKAAGATVRTSAPVKRILVAHDRVRGVELDSGGVIEAGTVISNADPKTTVMDLVGARHFETGFVRRIQNIRMRGNAAKLHLALDGLPDIAGLDRGDYGQRLLIAPDMDYVERAFNPAKYGECSPQPVLEISFPTVNDPALAPSGKHVLCATVQYAPYRLKGGWSDAAKERYAKLVIDKIDAYAPGLGEQVTSREFLSPKDLEQRFRVHGGHWHHGELALDQFLFVRPVIGAPQYALPLNGLYLCGAGAHPGGGIAGAAGRNAALTVLKEEKPA